MIKRLGVCLLSVAAIVFLDQWFKCWVTINIKGTPGRELPTGLLRLIYVENRGAAFGILQNMRWMFVILGLVVIAAIVFIIVKENIKSPFALVGATFIIAGTLGNLWDRAVNGFVVDMFELTFINFAIFNIADLSLTVGGVITCLFILLHKPK